ncbi:uncharacterized protein LOC120293017 [Eucalyptus grandis]|uniref:uncharacterized protein LOC120293017 n=1 Tax=Eucalyptus grandis TaxID=71139 RepID=UPI00192EC807|nr:uncharacterized protein LOC120293017 [Eucalyptus grandis]
MLKYIWILFTDKESLWCRWIHSNFLKKDNFWIASTPSTCSWAWKKILQLRTEFRSCFAWKIGNGFSVSLWHDQWLADGPLDLLFPTSIIELSGLLKHAVVADLFSPLDHAFKSSLQSCGFSVPDQTNAPDCFTWNQHSSGSFSVASAWDFIRTKKERVSWDSFIWNSDIVPRNQFNLWLITKNRLPTQEFLIHYGRIVSGTCAYCNATSDSIDHLFFNCRISATLAYFWATRCNLPWKSRPWMDNLAWAIRLLSALVVPALKNHLMKIVKDKATTFTSVPDTPRNRRLQRSWDLDPSIFTDRLKR